MWKLVNYKEFHFLITFADIWKLFPTNRIIHMNKIMHWAGGSIDPEEPQIQYIPQNHSPLT